MDVTVVMPLQQATLAGAATTPGSALDYAFANKVRGAEEECRAQGIAFLPMVAESLGGWHSVAEREVRKLGAALARHTGQEEGEAISHLWGRLGVLLQRGNAAILGQPCLLRILIEYCKVSTLRLPYPRCPLIPIQMFCDGAVVHYGVYSTRLTL